MPRFRPIKPAFIVATAIFSIGGAVQFAPAFAATHPTLQVDRYGAIRVGMSLDNIRALGYGLKGGGRYGTAGSFVGTGCELGEVASYPGVSIMFTNGRVVRFFVMSNRIVTDHGIRVGDSLAELERAYPGSTVSPDVYGGEDVTWQPPRPFKNYRAKFIVRKNAVQIIIAGRLPEVDYVEGCI